MTFNPVLTVADRRRPAGCFDPKIDDTLRRLILDFVRNRSTAIRNGERAKIDATYDEWGLGLRDHALSREDHERTSYYDWYMNRLERGFASDVSEIHVIPIEDAGLLPFRHNVTWCDLPEFDVRIRTADAEVSWLIRVEDDQLFVMLPNFCDAPWKEPILETRGGRCRIQCAKICQGTR